MSANKTAPADNPNINLVLKKEAKGNSLTPIRSNPRETAFVFFSSFAIGAVFFIAVYGWRILDGCYVDWILNAGGDLAQSYYGWCFFRNSDWHFPIGLMDSVAYPWLTSIIYIDSVPLFNILFKILSPLLPETFQFFGLWGLCCLALNGGIGALIIRSLSKDAVGAIMSAPIFVITTFTIQRLYTHTALAANWLILLAILIAVLERNRTMGEKDCLLWASIFALGVAINIYYLPILAIIMLINCVYHGSLSKKWLMPFLTFISSLAGTFICFWLLGGLYHLGSTGLDALNTGAHSSNLNSLFNPMETLRYLSGFSAFLPSRPLAYYGQYEGYGYLGLGGLLLCLFAAIGFVVYRFNRLLTHKEFFLVVVTFILFVVASMGVVATFDDKVLFEIPYPEFFNKIWSTFRSNGRFIWGAWNIAVISALAVIFVRYPRKVGRIIVCLCMALQIADLNTMLNNRHEIYFHRQNTYIETCNVEGVQSLLEGKKHIQIMDPNRVLKLPLYYNLGEAALREGATINDFYYSRRDTASIVAHDKEQQKALEAQQPDNETLYVFSSAADAELYQNILKLYYLDGLIFGRTEQCSNPVDAMLISNMETVSSEEIDSILNDSAKKQGMTILLDVSLKSEAESAALSEFEFLDLNDDGGKHALGFVSANEIETEQLTKLMQISDVSFRTVTLA